MKHRLNTDDCGEFYMSAFHPGSICGQLLMHLNDPLSDDLAFVL